MDDATETSGIINVEGSDEDIELDSFKYVEALKDLLVLLIVDFVDDTLLSSIEFWIILIRSVIFDVSKAWSDI